MGSFKNPCTTSYRSSIDTIALNCLVFEKIAFLCTHFGDRQTDRHEQMDSIDAQLHIQGRRWCDPPLWSDREFLDNFCTVLWASFRDWTLKSAPRAPMLLVHCLCFCLLKTASKCSQTYYVGDKKMIFSWEGPAPSTKPHLLNAYGASPRLTEIIYTPLSMPNRLNKSFPRNRTSHCVRTCVQLQCIHMFLKKTHPR